MMAHHACANTITLTSANAIRFGMFPDNPDAEDMARITGYYPGSVLLDYKAELDGRTVLEEGLFRHSYTTTFSNTPLDPSDALVHWDGGLDPYITGGPI